MHLFLVLLILVSCAQFRAVEIPTDPKRDCELRCTEALSRSTDPDVLNKACSCIAATEEIIET